MPSPADVGATKYARKIFGKHGLDITGADIRVSHGVCTIRGVIKAAMGTTDLADLETQVKHLAIMLRRRNDVREVTLDVSYH